MDNLYAIKLVDLKIPDNGQTKFIFEIIIQDVNKNIKEGPLLFESRFEETSKALKEFMLLRKNNG